MNTDDLAAAYNSQPADDEEKDSFYWVLFVGFFSLVPVIMASLMTSRYGTSELLVASIVISADGLGTLLPIKKKERTRGFLVLLSLVLLTAAAILFGYALNSGHDDGSNRKVASLELGFLHIEQLAVYATIAFPCSLLVSYICKRFQEA